MLFYDAAHSTMSDSSFSDAISVELDAGASRFLFVAVSLVSFFSRGFVAGDAFAGDAPVLGPPPARTATVY